MLRLSSIDDPAGFVPAPPLNRLGIAGVMLGIVALPLGFLPMIGLVSGLPLAIIGILFSGIALVGAVTTRRAGWLLPAIGVALNAGVVAIVVRLYQMVLAEWD